MTLRLVWFAAGSARIVLTVVLAGFLGAALIRWAPGTLVDERENDARYSRQSLEIFRAERTQYASVLGFYASYLSGLARGDFGESIALGRPVRELLAERLAPTARSAGAGILLGWCVGLLLAAAVTSWGIAALDFLGSAVCGALLAVPAGALALGLLWAGAPAAAGVGLILFPKVFGYARDLLRRSWEAPHILAARARGLSRTRILFWHCLPLTAAPLLALAGVSVNAALGAVIVLEAVTGEPGAGQLVWIAAASRDVPVLVTLTLLVTLVTLLANSLARVGRSREAAH